MMKERMHNMGLVKKDAPFVAVHIGDNSLLSHEDAQQIMDPYGVIVGYDGLEIDLKGRNDDFIKRGKV